MSFHLKHKNETMGVLNVFVSVCRSVGGLSTAGLGVTMSQLQNCTGSTGFKTNIKPALHRCVFIVSLVQSRPEDQV